MDSGKVVIKTELNTEQIDKDIATINGKLQKLEDKFEEPIEINGVKIHGLDNATEEEITKYNELQDQLQQLIDKKYDFSAIDREITNDLQQQEAIMKQQNAAQQQNVAHAISSTAQIAKLSGQLEEMVQEYNDIRKANIISSEDLARAEILKQDITKTANEIQRIGGGKINIKGITDVNQQVNAIKSSGLGIESQISKINNGLQRTVAQVGRWIIGIFGVYSAYSLVSRAMNILTQYDKQLASNIEYIQYALASTLKPLIENIIGLVVKLLQWINYIANAWFGVNLFANASAKAFDSARKSAEGTAKSTKKASKNAKDMNKQLASGIDEITNLQEPQKDTGNDGSGAEGSGITSPSFDLAKLPEGEIPEWIKWIADHKDTVISALLGIAGGLIALSKGFGILQSLGIGLIIAGIYLTIKGIVDFIKNPSWENFAKILEGLALILAGIAITMIAINATNPVGWIILAIAAITALVALIIKNWDKIKKVLSKVGEWIYENVIQPVINFFKGLWDGIKKTFAPVIEFFKSIWNTVKENIRISVENIKAIFIFLWKGIKKIFGPVVDWFKNKFKKAYEKVKEVFSPIVNFFSKLWNKITAKLKKFGAKIGEVVGKAFKAVINAVLAFIENKLNLPIKAINALIGVINKVPGIKLKTLTLFKLPRLARGGIVNNPGKGVNMGDYIAGERGAEAIVPLQNSRFINDFASDIADKIGGGLTTELLIELNKNILKLADTPMYFVVNGKELAKATYDDFKQEQRGRNQSATVVRR